MSQYVDVFVCWICSLVIHVKIHFEILFFCLIYVINFQILH